jgi:hypothetical protein
MSTHYFVARATFCHHGVAAGDFRFHFSALAFPQAAGHLKPQGRVEGGHLVGEHVGYAPDGAFISNATFNLHGEIKPGAGTLDLARQLAGADYQLLGGLTKIVEDSL